MDITERRLTEVLIALLTICLVAAAASALLLGRRAAVADRPRDTVVPSSSASSTDRLDPTSGSSDPSTSPSVTKPVNTDPDSSAPSPTSVPPPTPPSTSTPPTATSPTTTPPTTTPPPTTDPAPSSASSTPGTSGAALDPPVALSAQAANHPDATAIQKLVSLNFKSINTLDYQLWVDTVTPEQSAAFGPERWLDAYRTSKDSTIEIVSIDPDSRWITMTFNSSQAIDKAPPDARSTCLNWRVVLPVVTVNDKLRLAKSVEGLSKYSGCE